MTDIYEGDVHCIMGESLSSADSVLLLRRAPSENDNNDDIKVMKYISSHYGMNVKKPLGGSFAVVPMRSQLLRIYFEGM